MTDPKIFNFNQDKNFIKIINGGVGVKMLDNRVLSLSEDDLSDYICWIAWRDKPYCPRCEATQIVKRSFKSYYCPDCKYHFSPRSISPFKGTRFQIKNWILYLYIYLEDNNIRKCDFQRLAKIKYIQAVDSIFEQIINFLKSKDNEAFFYEVFTDFDKYLKYLDKIGKTIEYEHKIIYKKSAPPEEFRQYRLRGRVLAKRTIKTSGRNHLLYFLTIKIANLTVEAIVNRTIWLSIPDVKDDDFIFYCDTVCRDGNIQALIKNYKKASGNDIIHNDDFLKLCEDFKIKCL